MKKIINVVGAVILDDDKIFCAQRSVNMTLPLMWEFPGGKIEKGELPEDALKREIKEELNIDIEIISALPESTYEYPGLSVTLIPFIVKWTGGEMVIKEHESVQWLTKDQLFLPEWAAADLPVVRALDHAEVWKQND